MTPVALLVVDMINDFLDPAGSLYVGEAGRAAIPFVAAKIVELRRQGALIIFLNDAHAADDPEFQRFAPHGVKGAWGGALIAELEMAPGDLLVEKTHFSGLVDTSLETLLRRHGVKEVHLVGVCTSICVMETARDLDLQGFRVVVYRDGVADLHREDHEWGLERMARLFGVVVK